MTIEHYLLIALIQTTLSVLVAILSFIRFSARDLVVRLIGFVFLTGCLANIAAWLLVKTQVFRTLTNIPGGIYTMVAVALYSWIYFIVLHKKNAKPFILVAGMFIIFGLANLFLIQKTQTNSYSYFLLAAILIVYTLLYFYVLMRDLPSLHLHRIPMFWFNAGLLIFHSGTFFLIAFTSYLVNVLKDDLLIYWSFHNILSIIEHFIFLIGLYYDLKSLKSKKKSSPSYA